MVIDILSKPRYLEFPPGINKQYIDHSCYELDRKTNTLTISLEGDYEKFPVKRAPELIGAYSLEKLKNIKKALSRFELITFILLVCIIFFNKILGNIFWPIVILSFFFLMIFIIITDYLSEIEVYYIISRCKKCGRNFAYEEFKKPLIEKISTYDYYEIIETRYMKCKYCKNRDIIKKNLQRSCKSRKKKNYKKGRACQACGKQPVLLEYRYPDIHLENKNLLRTIRHYKCISCRYMEISIKDEIVYDD